MGGGFKRRELTDTFRIHLHPLVVDIFRKHHWLGFFELVKGYDDDIAQEFAMALNPQARTNATTVLMSWTMEGTRNNSTIGNYIDTYATFLNNTYTYNSSVAYPISVSAMAIYSGGSTVSITPNNYKAVLF